MNPSAANTPRPKHRLLTLMRRWHLWGGVIAALFLLVFGLTGIVLNYKKPLFRALGLESPPAPRAEAARPDTPDPAGGPAGAGPATPGFTTATGFAAAGIGPEAALAAGHRELGEVPLERIELKQEAGGLVWKIKSRDGREVLVHATTGHAVTKGRYEKLGPADAQGRPARSFDWGKFLLDLHTGQIGGEVGKALMTLAAAGLLFLTGSGLYLWLKPLLIRRANARNRASRADSPALSRPRPRPAEPEPAGIPAWSRATEKGHVLWLCLGSLVLGAPLLRADPAPEPEVEPLPRTVVYGEAESEGISQEPFFPPVLGTEIFSGKKATVIDLDALPQVQANNYRQALTHTPGLLYSEETTPLVSLGYRGIGEPHRAQFLQVLQDGIPIHADPIGYPEAYYTPPLEVVDRLEFVRGGAALLYGPQPAGALNYRTYWPRLDRPFSARTRHVFGSDNFYSTYNAVDGTTGNLGYLAYYHHRQSDGFRTANSDYVLDGGHFKLVWGALKPTRWTLAFDGYAEEHGEPGGLTFQQGPGYANYDEDRTQASRRYDRFRLQRYVPSLALTHDFNDRTRAEVKFWGGYYDRFSRRQRGGGFGQLPSGPDAQSNSIERQEFYTFGTEARLRHDYLLGDADQTLTAGVHFYRGDSPRTDARGDRPEAESGRLLSRSQRNVYYGAAFAENRFQVGRLSVTPGVRLENVAQDVTVRRPTDAGEVVTRKQRLDVQPLVGLGLEYALPHRSELYASVAQSYRPPIFSESIVPASGTVVAGDVRPNTAWAYELGARGQPRDWLTWDTSLFLMDLDDKFGGTVNQGGQTVLRSVGRSLNYGGDAGLELELFGLARALAGETESTPEHRLSVHANTALLAAQIHGGALDGKRPQYAPEYLVRTGLIYRWRDRLKLALLGTIVADHFATDDENPTRRIPAYTTWDLTLEAKVYRDTVSVLAGVNNLFDEDYYARIRGDGIDPAYGRHFYAGFQLSY